MALAARFFGLLHFCDNRSKFNAKGVSFGWSLGRAWPK